MARMIALQPALFLDGEWAPKQVQLAEASSLLRRELQGADCDFMFQVCGGLEGPRAGCRVWWHASGRSHPVDPTSRCTHPTPPHPTPPHPTPPFTAPGPTLPPPLQEDAAILFVPVPALKAGLEQMRELWPQLTPAALEASSPLHLSLAIQALGPLGPPKGF